MEEAQTSHGGRAPEGLERWTDCEDVQDWGQDTDIEKISRNILPRLRYLPRSSTSKRDELVKKVEICPSIYEITRMSCVG